MQFNPTGNMQTNYEMAMQILESVGLPRITIIWWQVTARTKDYPSRIEDKGTILISGYDGAILTLLLGGENRQKQEITPESAMNAALDQELLSLVQI